MIKSLKIRYGVIGALVLVLIASLYFTLHPATLPVSASDDNDTHVTDETYLYRVSSSGGSIMGGGTMNIEMLKGNSIVWNQLVDTSTTEVVTISGHKYMTRISGVEDIITSTGQTFNVVGTDNVFDLTAMFGEGKEFTTISEFKEMFPLKYYSYNAGKIISSNVVGIKSVGFNQWDGTATDGQAMASTGGTYASATSFVTDYIRVVPNQTYYLNPDNWADWVNWYDADKNFIMQSAVAANNTVIVPSGAMFIRLTGILAQKSTACFNFSLDGSRDGDFEEYEERTYDLPNVVLRSAGAVYDAITPDGTLTRKIGVVLNLGDGTVTVSDAGGANERALIYFRDIPSVSVNNNATYPIISSKYIARTATQTYRHTYDKAIAIAREQIAAGQYCLAFYLYDSDLIGKSTSQIKTALQGVEVYYKLETPVVTQSDQYAYTENQIVSDFGTQEVLPVHTSTPQTTPIRYDGVYVVANYYSIRYSDWQDGNFEYTFSTSRGVPESGLAENPGDPYEQYGIIGSGYYFAGWYTDEELTQPFDFETVLTEPIDLYAGIKETTSISFEERVIDQIEAGSQTSIDGYTIYSYDSSALTSYKDELPQYLQIKKRGAVAFSLRSASNVTITFANGGNRNITFGVDAVTSGIYTADNYYSYTSVLKTFTVAKGSVTLFGLSPGQYKFSQSESGSTWNIVSITISEPEYTTVRFVDYKRSAIPEQTVIIGDVAVRPDDVEVKGHTFLGWYQTTNEGDVVYDFETPVTEPVTLKGKYQVNTYTVRFSGVDINDVSAQYGSSLEAPQNPTLDGYTFIGWYTDEELTQPFDFETDTVQGDMTLYAAFKAQSNSPAWLEDTFSTVGLPGLSYAAQIVIVVLAGAVLFFVLRAIFGRR